MKLILNQLCILYVFLIAGFIIGKIKKGTVEHSSILSVLLVNIFLPLKVFKTFAGNFSVSYFKEKYYLLLASLALLAVLATIGFFVPKLLTKNKYERRIYQYSVPITNYAYLGYVLIGDVFGESVLSEFMFFAIPFIIYTYTVGYALLTGGEKPIKKLLNPITVAIVIGIAIGISGLSLPDTALKILDMASSCVGPLSMILTGITLSAFAFKELISNKTAYIFSALRLLVIPAAAYFTCRGLHLDTIAPMVLIITCMPCGLNTIVFPKLIGDDCKPGARLALVTHVFSLATLPLWLSLIK